VLGILLGAVGIILGLVGRGRPGGTGMATAGIVISAIGALAAIGWIVAWVVGLSAVAGNLGEGFPEEFEEEFEEDFEIEGP
jgi:hypothetical protein